MIEDIQVYSSIYHNDDTHVEYFADVAFQLSEVDAVNENSWPEWVNQEPKTDISLRSGFQITIMADFASMLLLWQRFRKQQQINNLLVRYN